ncbi:hypothetical protein E3Q23_01541 [Wallemia mellicola]|nr:hypothetical protein E3Q23_01541 [Wallemia mellicola]TIC44267.1 hypothetical protein E3Q08_02046 [Wallemia mellicola]
MTKCNTDCSSCGPKETATCKCAPGTCVSDLIGRMSDTLYRPVQIATTQPTTKNALAAAQATTVNAPALAKRALARVTSGIESANSIL